jgi:NADP-dependent 3-hydroxy acid dehydrogenase YdfG
VRVRVSASRRRSPSPGLVPLLLLARRVELLRQLGLKDSVCVAPDVREREMVIKAIAEGEAAHGPVDCLLNNTGIAPLAKLENQDPEEWRDVIDINCIGVLNCMHSLMPAMKERRDGTTINISSIAGRRSYPYTMSIAARSSSSMPLPKGEAQHGPFDVRVIAVSPGLTQTDISGTMLNKAAHDFWVSSKDSVGGISADDVAKTILFAYQMPQNGILQELTITPTRQEY